MRARVALTMGCPSGIGPEVAVAAAAWFQRAEPEVELVLVGDRGAFTDAARGLGLSLDRAHIDEVSSLDAASRAPGRPSRAGGVAQRDAIDRAYALVRGEDALAMVTAPVSKKAITDAGAAFLGHTEYLAAKAEVARVVMLFAGPRLNTALVTTHLPIARVSAAITRDAVSETVVLTARAMRDWWGLAAPRVAVCGLNPHAGEGGLLGHEERDVIGPAVATAREALGEGFTVRGPVPAEAVFRQARDGRDDAVVAMYHDQATIASKLVDFGDAVNVTLGLPFVRTSVDHGTAYDIAGQGVADSRGMRAALSLGVRLGRQRSVRLK